MKNIETLSKIERNREELEMRIAKAVHIEVSQWQAENEVLINSVYVNLEQIYTLGGRPKSLVTGANVDLQYDGYLK